MGHFYQGNEIEKLVEEDTELTPALLKILGEVYQSDIFVIDFKPTSQAITLSKIQYETGSTP